MKRSEILEYLTDEIMDIIHDAETRARGDTISKFCQRKAEGVLCMIEGFGMLPPKWSYERKRTRKSASTGKIIGHSTSTIQMNGWEPEDE